MLYDKALEASEYIKTIITDIPKTAVILGSGLSNLANKLENKIVINYEDIPNFPTATVDGHGNSLICGTLNGTPILAFTGRFHFFEGYSMRELSFPVFMLKPLGVENLIVTNSAGGVNTEYKPGSIMIINDFINFVSDNPLRGDIDKRFGERFTDMSEPFSTKLIDIAKSVGKEHDIELNEGVYAYFQGPYYETKAEIRMARIAGADTVGMSTVPETIAANHIGLNVLGFSCVTVMACGIDDVKLSHEEVLEVANEISKKLTIIVENVVSKI